jgi:cobalt-zinc-cadmium efflux system membrane fusion protein
MKRDQLFVAATVALAFLLVATAGCSRDPGSEGALETADNRAGAQADRCLRHSLSWTECFICDPSLREPGRLWCTEHDRYEDRCFVCHPELEDPERLWCTEHNLYEDECFLCHPELQEAATAKAPVTAGLHCGEHNLPESECGICHPELAASLEPGSGLKIRFESTRSAARAGVETARPIVASGSPDTSFLTRVTWDQNHFARVTPLADGVLQRVESDVGQVVSRGQRMATLMSPEVSRSKTSYLSARADEELKLIVLAREERLVEQQVSAQQQLDQARAEHEIARNETAMARQRLLNLGLTAEAVRAVEEIGSTSSELDILAPLSGTIVDRHAVPGEAVELGDALFKIARLSSMWLELSIPEHEVALVSVGQRVRATFDAHPGMQAIGRVTWVGSSVDEHSRMVMGRAEVPNPDRLLRNGMFGQAHLQVDDASGGLSLPAGAVQHIDEQPFVFARLADDLFELRRVSLGATDRTRVLVTAGIDPEDEIVVTHSFTLKSEFLKSRLGAGCVDD